jgi:hypothetical protein
VQLQKEGLNKYDKKAAQHCHTNKYRSLLAALWRHAFPNKYAEIEMSGWWTPRGATISTEVWFVEINRLELYRAEIYGVSLRDHLFQMHDN